MRLLILNPYPLPLDRHLSGTVRREVCVWVSVCLLCLSSSLLLDTCTTGGGGDRKRNKHTERDRMGTRYLQELFPALYTIHVTLKQGTHINVHISWGSGTLVGW